MTWKVQFFKTLRGDCPVEEFIKEQDVPTYTKILHSILLLKNIGPFLKPPYNKKIANNLYELRIPGKNAIRIFYTYIASEFCLLHAFKKKTEKTPEREIKIAIDRMKEII